jgi:hypothetical protein
MEFDSILNQPDYEFYHPACQPAKRNSDNRWCEGV